jgi:hypothetical protein
MQRVIIAGATVCCPVSKRHTKHSAVYNEMLIAIEDDIIGGWVARQDKVAIRFLGRARDASCHVTQRCSYPRPTTYFRIIIFHNFIKMHEQSSNNGSKRRRLDADQDVSTLTPGTALQPRGRSGSSSAGPHTGAGSQLHQVPASNNVLLPSNHEPDFTKFPSISEWIARLSQDDLQGLLADAAARHQDVFHALQTKSQILESTREQSKLRLEEQLMDTFCSGWRTRDISGSTSTPALVTEQAVVLEETGEEDEEEDYPEFATYPAEVKQLLVGNVEGATSRIAQLVDKMAGTIRHNSLYKTKAVALVAFFNIAECLIGSSGTPTTYAREDIMAQGYCNKALKISRYFDEKEAFEYLRDEIYTVELWECLFASLKTGPIKMLISKMHLIILDLRSRACKAPASKEVNSESQLRVKDHLVDTFHPGRHLPGTSTPTTTPAIASQQAVVQVHKPRVSEESKHLLQLERYANEIDHLLEEKWKHLRPIKLLDKVGLATESFFEIVDRVANSAVYTSSSLTKSVALLGLFRFAEILTGSSSLLASHVQGVVMDGRFDDKVLEVSRRLDAEEAVAFVYNKKWMKFLEGCFKEKDFVPTQSSSIIVFQMKSVISDLKRRALVIETTELQGNS